MAQEAGRGLRSWTKDVPKQLRGVISDLRDNYSHAHSKIGQVTQEACFTYLHGAPDEQERKLRDFHVSQIAVPLNEVQINTFNQRIHEGTLPAIFSAYYCLYRDRMTLEALRFFNEALSIADANAAGIPTNADEWAENQALHIVGSCWWSIVPWVIWVCDRDTIFEPTKDSKHVIELTLGTLWLAPRFLFMEPSVFAWEEYNPELLWERLNAMQTRSELQRLADTFVQGIEEVVQNNAKSLRLQRAKGGKVTEGRRMAADRELDKLRSDIKYAEELAKLKEKLSAIDGQLERLNRPGLQPLGSVLFYRRYYQRERDKVSVEIELLTLPQTIERLEREHDQASSPGSQAHHQDRLGMLRASRAIGGSQETSEPPNPQVAASTKLRDAIGSLKSAEQRMQDLTNHDVEWEHERNVTPYPEIPAPPPSKAPPPPSPVRGGRKVAAEPKRTTVPTVTLSPNTIETAAPTPKLRESTPAERPVFPAKKITDLSRYMDGANLTDKQYDCFSLKYEYSLNFVEVAKSMHLDRSTVRQHVAGALKKMKTLNDREGFRKALAKRNVDKV